MTGPQADIKLINETVSFPFDRVTVDRFRETFPTARWNDHLQAWTVPGKTARKRIESWLASEADRQPAFSEERGRDAFQFEPILSQYLQVVPTGFKIRTPYSREVVDQLRQIRFARWNGPEKVCEVPFGSYDDLQHGWKIIEEAAKRAEPEERRKRADARKGTEEEAIAKRGAKERRKHRLPFPSDNLPPLYRPVATTTYGIVVITEITGEFVEPLSISERHPQADAEHI
ncbi:hypothetical protein [Rhizobium sp. RM]|uniref:hypothetical protein n=1 Tax=Rhizobium sp. RM TaxID=2748079 RepID=UPI00336551D9